MPNLFSYYLWIVAASILFILLGFLKEKLNRQKKIERQRIREPKLNLQSSKSDHLDLVIQHQYKRKPLMNYSESRLFDILTELLTRTRYQEFRLFSQVAMGEFLESDDRTAHFAVNNKRVDFLIVDKKGYPVMVIEYQGEGHYQDNAAKRDAVKKEACRKAGVLFLEFFPHYGKSELQLVCDGLMRYQKP